MRRSRKRRPRVAWFPTFGAVPLAEATSGPAAGVEQQFEVDTFVPNGDVVWDATALTFDVSEGSAQAQSDPNAKTLRDIIQGNEWRLRRIVGKAFIHATQGTQGASGGTLADVALGFIVVKTDDDGGPTTDFGVVNPLVQDSMEDPWIWRRRWLLQPAGQHFPTVPNTGDLRNNYNYIQYPSTTAGYGSVMDGPHIDAKIGRRIHRSERLYSVLAARKWNPNIGTGTPIVDFRVTCLLDYRILGSLGGSSYGNRGNTSR